MIPSATLTQFNWIDVLLFMPVMFRGVYIGIKEGVVIELFKTLGLVLISYFTLHYYSPLGDFLANNTPALPEGCYIFSYIFISFLIWVGFTLGRQSILTIVKVETAGLLKTWGGAILGFLRGILLSSIIFIFLLMWNGSYLTGSIRQSYFGNRLTCASPNVYKFVFENIIAKFSPDERLNRRLFKLVEEE
ncbi:MAG: CvpA family protein [Candidatus Omnitrophota bacterium]|nr:CvpA family protein [Candidatus Omnitrophota bacterium]